MNATSTRNVVVEAGGTQVVGHVGLHALGAFADRLSVGETLSRAIGWAGLAHLFMIGVGSCLIRC